MNLLDCQVEDWRMKVAGEWCDKRVTPRLIVVEPDFPLDISSIATCFTEMGHHPLLYLLNQMKPRQTTQAILLGNFASEALDDVINSSQYRFEETLRENFQANAIDFCACEAFPATRSSANTKKRKPCWNPVSFVRHWGCGDAWT